MRSVVLIICFFLLIGCAQTMKQHSSMVDAINGTLTPINYNKTYIFSTFGYPDSQRVSVADNVQTEVWTYKTNMSKSGLLLRVRPGKTRFMRITIVNNIVTDVTFEK